MRIEEALAGRQGSNQYQQKVDLQNFVEAPKGELRDIAPNSGWLTMYTLAPRFTWGIPRYTCILFVYLPLSLRDYPQRILNKITRCFSGFILST